MGENESKPKNQVKIKVFYLETAAHGKIDKRTLNEAIETELQKFMKDQSVKNIVEFNTAINLTSGGYGSALITLIYE